MRWILRAQVRAARVCVVLTACVLAATASITTYAFAQAATAEATDQSETWDAIFIQGAKAGYGRTQESAIEEGGARLRRTNATARMSVKRLGQKIDLVMVMQSVEQANGQVVRFRSEVSFGPTPAVTEGQVQDGKVIVRTTTLGKTTKSTIPWSEDYGGFFAADRSIEGKPMKPGERRSFKALVPVFNRVADIELIADDYEETKMLDGKQRLLKINNVTKLGIASIKSVMWSDEEGRLLKTFEPTMNQESFRTTREVALRGNDLTPDLIIDTVVRLQGKNTPRGAQQVHYQITMKNDDPATVFPDSVSQAIKSDEDETVLVVRRVRLADEPGSLPKAATAQPTRLDREPNNWIQSDDAEVVRMAKSVLPDEEDPTRLAAALETFVNKTITEKNFSTALGTAAEVARSRQGDCTEHAVLLAALARARGIPARIVIGLVYLDSLRGFGYHMWNEVWTGNAWMPLDGTRAQGGTGSGHIKLADSNLNNGDGATAFLPVLRVIGNLQIKVVRVDRD